jgi:hypothetical protein
MGDVLPIVPAEFLQLQLLGHRLPVLRRGVVLTLTFGALKRNDFSAALGHVSLRELKIENGKLKNGRPRALQFSIFNFQFLF